MNAKNFFVELRRRNIYRVAVAYAIVAWLIIQVATQTFPFLEIPNWCVRLLLASPGPVDNTNVCITSSDLRKRWQWDPLREDPRFQQLLAPR